VITTVPEASRTLIESSSTISFGRGDGTTRRQPRPASSATAHPSSRSRRRASASSMNPPMGFEGEANAGSSRSTSVCEMIVATFFFSARWYSSFCSACCSS
jgi:hypothetical protein